VVLFVRLREGVELDETLQQQIRQTIRANTTPRHVPAKIVAVTDIPGPSAAKSSNWQCAMSCMGKK
jgi:acetoacetyl-CoA synthetase